MCALCWGWVWEGAEGLIGRRLRLLTAARAHAACGAATVRHSAARARRVVHRRRHSLLIVLPATQSGDRSRTLDALQTILLRAVRGRMAALRALAAGLIELLAAVCILLGSVVCPYRRQWARKNSRR